MRDVTHHCYVGSHRGPRPLVSRHLPQHFDIQCMTMECISTHRSRQLTEIILSDPPEVSCLSLPCALQILYSLESSRQRVLYCPEFDSTEKGQNNNLAWLYPYPILVYHPIQQFLKTVLSQYFSAINLSLISSNCRYQSYP